MRGFLLTLLVLLGSTIAPGAQDDWTGRYAGDWASAGAGASGLFKLTLTPGAGGQWGLEVSFTLADTEVKTKVNSIKIDGAKIEARYEFDLQGNRLESTITGERDGGRLTGKYTTKTVAEGAPVDQGEWKAAVEKKQ